MKTKSAIVMLMMVMGFAQANATESSPSLKIVRKEGSNVFFVTYHTTRHDNARMTLKDSKDRVLFTESIKRIKNGFSVPVNLSDLEYGVYSVEVDNGQEKEIQTIEYSREKQTQKLLTYAHVTQLENHRYLLSVSGKSNEKIRITVLDDDHKIFQQESLIDGNFAAIYHLKNFSGLPIFVVTDLSNRSHVIE